MGYVGRVKEVLHETTYSCKENNHNNNNNNNIRKKSNPKTRKNLIQ